jgi:acylphosphatase
MSKEELHGFVSGTVQGVGFRAALRNYALEYRLTGFVRNVEDGRVEFLVQGPKRKIEEFLETVKGHPGVGHIEKKWQEVKESLPTFEIIR